MLLNISYWWGRDGLHSNLDAINDFSWVITHDPLMGNVSGRVCFGRKWFFMWIMMEAFKLPLVLGREKKYINHRHIRREYDHHLLSVSYIPVVRLLQDYRMWVSWPNTYKYSVMYRLNAEPDKLLSSPSRPQKTMSSNIFGKLPV